MLDETIIPPYRINSSEDLSHIQAVRLYENWNAGVQRIIRTLQCDDPELSRVWYLIDVLGRPFDRERLHAIEQLGDMGALAKPAVVAILKASKVANPQIKLSAFRALKKIGPANIDAVSLLAEALEDPDQTIRWLAINALVQIKPVGSEVDQIVSALLVALNNPDKDVRRRAAEGLSDVAPLVAETVPTLIGRLKDPVISSEVCSMLSRIGSAAIPSLLIALVDPETRPLVAAALGGIRSVAAEYVPLLTERLKSEPDESVRWRIYSVLSRTGPTPVPMLTLALKDPNEGVRYNALMALIGVTPVTMEVVSALAVALKDADKKIKRNAAIALGDMGATAIDAVPALIAALKEKDHIRTCAAYALEKIGMAAVPTLTVALEDADPEIRRETAFVLRNIIGPTFVEVMPVLAGIPTDSDEEVRRKESMQKLKYNLEHYRNYFLPYGSELN